MGVGVRISLEGLGIAKAKLEPMANLDLAKLANGLARLGAEQTKRRITSEKTSPAGRAWPKNIAGTSILFSTGSNLHDSIDHRASVIKAEWGSGWIGARVHQFGAVIKPVNAKHLAFSIGGKTIYRNQVLIPARPYLGVSADNRNELEATTVRFIEGVVK